MAHYLTLVLLFLFGFSILLNKVISWRKQVNNKKFYRAKQSLTFNTDKKYYRPSPFEPKPQWVKERVIRMKALMPDEGCRKISDTFNRQYAVSKNMSVGKTTVANIIKQHQYQIQVQRQKLKHQQPKAIPRQLIWGMDLTFKADSKKQMHAILGIIEHHSRKNMRLKALKNKATSTLIIQLIKAIEKYGRPKIIRTDNEAVFTSRLFTLSLWLLGIKHQRIDKHSPWQNGRIERFFGTLKPKPELKGASVESLEQFNTELYIFRAWYNKVRTHNNLNGKTPDEVWNNTNVSKHSYENCYYINQWEGRLTGFYHPT